ncbi:hypothetical protein [Desulfuribacillus alkaliarsenatis]|uniref:NodB homology domain-containing protein n=1 Tax=Desulfuribacillus alkaliarsenatis TaxID=766136 RepID=A0A1E5G1P2_9FIRM|nr:hypothetical protein [Desulfuribacillus alkaliarsenatis]OEF96828.1 hypothetical protein BHF68_07145 [Desulfuribacillus alkaliarsenatis]
MISFLKKLLTKGEDNKARERIFDVTKKNDGVNYIDDFIGLINLKNVHMTEVYKENEPCLYIRHDVDHSLEMGLKKAEVEAELGYKSTYFLLPTGSYGEEKNYYGTLEDGKIKYDSKLIDKCKRLLELGHHIGLHNDMVAMSLKLRKDPAELIKRELDYFDKHNIELVGTAAHGSPLARQLKFNNRELFDGCIRKGWEQGRTIEHNGWKVKLHSLNLSDFGFQYEAYSLPRDSRISESGGRWGGRILGNQIDRDKMFNDFNLEEFKKLISTLTPNSGVRAMQVMTHPCHWEVKENGNNQ